MKCYTRPQLYRLKTIHEMVNDKTFPNCTNFCKKFEVSRATINRDLDILRYDFRAPLEFDKDKKGYYYTSGFELPYSGIDKADTEVLMCAKRMIENYKNTPLYDSLSTTIASIIDPDRTDNENDLFNRIEVTQTIDYGMINQEIWGKIISALKNDKILEFDYTSGKNVKTHRKVEPYQIIFDNGKIFLFANQAGKDEIDTKLFSIFKIENLKILDEKFKLPKVFEFSKLIEGGKFGAYHSNLGKLKFKIEFYGGSRIVIKGAKISNDQKIYDDELKGCTIAEFTSHQLEQILGWIIPLAEKAIPIEPEPLVTKWKDYWRDKIQKMPEFL